MPLRLSDLTRRLFRRFTKPATNKPSAKRFRPMLEACEERTVPSTVNVVSLGQVIEGGAGAFRISRDSPGPSSLAVNFTVGGSATSGSDYTSPGTSATIPAFALYVDVPVSATDDADTETTEEVTLTLASGGYRIRC
jgi:hypothetical protein